MVDFARAARLLRELAAGTALQKAAEKADYDIPQARDDLLSLAARLDEQARELEKDLAAQRAREARREQVADSPNDLFFAFDGGSRGNPGPAAGAAVACDASGYVLTERTFFFENATNNVAEYHGLLAAIELATELGVTRLRIQGDSELIVKQLKGEYRVKNKNLMPLFLKAIRELRQFEKWEVMHVPREENRAADQLVNEVLDEKAPRKKRRR